MWQRQKSRRALSGSQQAARISSLFFTNAILSVFSISCIFPVIWLIYSSFKTNRQFGADIIGLPASLNIENYKDILSNSSILHYMWNTSRNTAISLLFIMIFGFIIGYFLSRFAFKGRNALYLLFLLGMLIPIHAIIVPEYILFKQFQLSNQWFTLVLPYVTFGLPLAIFLVESYVRSLPKEMEEAAYIDGSSFSRTLFTIIMPLTMPVLVTIGIIQFFSYWNEFIFGLILINDESLMTVPVGLARLKGQFSADYPRMMTVMIIAIAPAMALYFAFSKRIIEGMVAGAVKG
jgi:raffinose/stachyose/melibiose transport system permease protein